MFFDLYATGRLEGREAWLVDDNVDLIGCYRAVREDAAAVIRELARLDAGHRARGDAHFYDVRDRRFNRLRRALLADPDPARYTAAMAAMLIYLNRTGFNGLFRLNARGLFNVPVRLHRAVIAAARRGAAVIVSNSTATTIAELYGSLEARRTGFELHRVPARRAINSRAGSRGPVEEFVWANLERKKEKGKTSLVLG